MTNVLPVGDDLVVPRTAIGDLADLTEEQFERAINRGQLAETRARYILDNLLIDGAHYGNPKGENEEPKYAHPILYLGGAEKLIRAFRLTLYATGPQERAEVLPPTLDFSGRIPDPAQAPTTSSKSGNC